MRQRVALYSPSGSRKVNAAAQLCFSYLFSSRLESPCYPPSGTPGHGLNDRELNTQSGCC
ncbi:rCG35407 [Rattus norvegicus]|uniref:RCG35407 n=1 Tax=Rattus norvegicus TaxID=10116 RepID=A6HEB3_RAT|nr:rCG35407 [Rattus norvegicus]